MNCKQCDNDLMARIEPKGLDAIQLLLPMTPYRCVKCGARQWELTGGAAGLVFRVFFALALVGLGAGGAYWLADMHWGNSDAPVVEADPAPLTAPGDQAAMATRDKARISSIPKISNPKISNPEIILPPPSKPKPERSAGGDGLDEVDVAQLEPKARPASKSAPSSTPASASEPKTQPTPTAGITPKAEPAELAPPARRTIEKRRIMGIGTMEETDRLVVSVAAGGSVEEFTVHTWPPKFVIDLPGEWEYRGPAKIAVGKRGLAMVRVAAHQTPKPYFRLVLVFDTAPAVPPQVRHTPGGLAVLVK